MWACSASAAFVSTFSRALRNQLEGTSVSVTALGPLDLPASRFEERSGTAKR